MLCSKPFKRGVAEFGCGQCLPCRINHKRIWMTRLMLEHAQHRRSFFVTLTYDDAHLPTDQNLRPRDLTLYLKRLRHLVEPRKIRFYGVGEYGEKYGRPHYHVLVFGDATKLELAQAWSDPPHDFKINILSEGYSERMYYEVKMQAGYGIVHVGTVTNDSIGYCAQYALDGWSSSGVKRAGGRAPPFSRMSRRPGIGFGAVPTIVDAVHSIHVARRIAGTGDLPNTIRVDGRVVPMGRYLLGKVRELSGYKVKYRRGEQPLQVSMLKRQLEALEPGAREKLEGLREASAHRARWLLRKSKSGDL